MVPRAAFLFVLVPIFGTGLFFYIKIYWSEQKMNYQKLKGTHDYFPEELVYWQYIEKTANEIFKKYCFGEIRLPIIEKLELFSRSVGETSDIVTKEMYDFYDKGDRHIVLRPEGTASVARAYVENKYFGPEHHKPAKYFYFGPMFRYERPQSGRMRQFHQLGVEVFGSPNPATDVETIAMAMELFKTLGLSNLRLVVNSLGDTESRDAFRQALIDYLEPQFDKLSEDSKVRLHKNPLRVLDSKDPKDKEIVKDAPSILDYLNEESSAHFEAVKDLLETIGIPYEIDQNMVRGLDYYNDTIFEIMADSKGLGSNNTVCAGGRYDGLVEDVGGPHTPAFGFAFGMERMVMMLQAEKIEIPETDQLDVFIVGIGNKTNKETLKIVQALRNAGYSAERDFLFRKPKSQFKTANKLNAKVVLTLGENELENKTINFKAMASGNETTISLDKVYQEDFNQLFTEYTNE